MRIVLSRLGAASVRIGASTRSVVVDVDSIGGTVMVVARGSEGLSICVRPRTREARESSVRDSAVVYRDAVSPAMEAAAVRAFLGAADVGRLGRSLAAVYLAMEEERRHQADEGGGDAP